jgi:hypothetical protein
MLRTGKSTAFIGDDTGPVIFYPVLRSKFVYGTSCMPHPAESLYHCNLLGFSTLRIAGVSSTVSMV